MCDHDIFDMHDILDREMLDAVFGDDDMVLSLLIKFRRIQHTYPYSLVAATRPPEHLLKSARLDDHVKFVLGLKDLLGGVAAAKRFDPIAYIMPVRALVVALNFGGSTSLAQYIDLYLMQLEQMFDSRGYFASYGCNGAEMADEVSRNMDKFRPLMDSTLQDAWVWSWEFVV